MQEASQFQVTDQMKLVLEQKYRLLDSLIVANQKLDEKIDRIIQTGSIIIGLATFANLSSTPPLQARSTPVDGIRIAAILLSFVLFCVMVMIAAYVSRPIKWEDAGTSDWERTRSDYLASDNYYYQLMSDVITAIDSTKATNRYKAKWIRPLIIVLVGQVLALAVAVFLGALAP